MVFERRGLPPKHVRGALSATTLGGHPKKKYATITEAMDDMFNARVLEQSNGMPFRWKCTATWAHPYSFAFLDEYVHSPKSRSLAFFIELRAEVDHMNIMS